MSSRTLTNRRGFTLTEMLMVIVLVAITAMIVGPQVLEAGTMRAQAAGRAVIADILFAQSDAMARQTRRCVAFQPAADRYAVTDDAGAAIASGWTGSGQHEVDFNTDSRFDGVQLLSADFGGDTVLTFDALGAPESAGQVELVCGETRYRITVAAVTGRITIEPVESGE